MAADCDLFAAERHIDSAILDFPSAHWTLVRLFHEISLTNIENMGSVVERLDFPNETGAGTNEKTSTGKSKPINSRKETGGEGGIRTLDRGLRPYSGLANRRPQPLGDFSAPLERLIKTVEV